MGLSLEIGNPSTSCRIRMRKTSQYENGNWVFPESLNKKESDHQFHVELEHFLKWCSFRTCKVYGNNDVVWCSRK